MKRIWRRLKILLRRNDWKKYVGYSNKLMPELFNDKIKNHEKVGLLGRGTFGKVYKAKRKGTSDDRFYAMKVINPRTAHQKQLALREILVMMELRHRSIVLLNYGFKDKRKIVLLLEYCDMGSLKMLLEDRGKLENYLAASIFTDTCNGLIYLHNKKIVHCDIKPDNILLTKDGLAKITDFGVALGPGEKHEKFYGSDAYAAPETFLSNSYAPQCDVWSVGIVFYEMIFGYRPFNNMKEVLAREIEIPKQTPFAVHFLIRMMLQTEPNKRLALEEAIGGWILVQLNEGKKCNTISCIDSSQIVAERKALRCDG
ncbi:unnamed protein product [Cylicocyclus nassatus]|uniref:Protein kinase domain-containing protein n=1 Tax=Cylicocyclus nassatus TaxID=53992 RepID=A0AA36MAA2_CYLNA|nr:unnamed protein product [Cylicocyclus nassatus]